MFQITSFGSFVLDDVKADTETLGEIFARVIEEEMLERATVEFVVGIDGTSRPSDGFQTVSSTCS